MMGCQGFVPSGRDWMYYILYVVMTDEKLNMLSPRSEVAQKYCQSRSIKNPELHFIPEFI